MRAGDTYIRAGKHVAADPHLWIIISDPRQDKSHLVAVNATSQRSDKDQSCVIHAGEHSVITKESVILYAGARIVTESQLLAAVSAKLLKLKSATSPALLKKIRDGAAVTNMLPLAAKRTLQSQGIIPQDPPTPPATAAPAPRAKK